MHLPMLTDIVVILGLSVLILLLFQHLKLPSILGFLITGIVAGPYGLSLATNVRDVEMLAEIGVIFLLFIIGMEFSLKTLSSIKTTVLIGGLLQVGLTILVTMGITKLMGFSKTEGIFMGFLFALSSTAIVLKVLQEKGEMSTRHGRVIIAILIFQDIIVVPMMLVTPIMAGHVGEIVPALVVLLLKIAGLFAAMVISARYIFPRVLYRLAQSGNRQLFLLAVIVICFGSAWLTGKLGLSMALGAFFAGLVISESDYSHEATGFILPFREIFLSFFFISVGMLLDIRFLWSNLPVILGLTLLTFFFKGLIASLTTAALRHPASSTFIVGLSLFQVGEFSFILSKIGLDNGLLSEVNYQYFLAVSILTMGLTPFVIDYSFEIIEAMKKSPVSPIMQGIEFVTKLQKNTPQLTVESLSGHLVIIGYGLNGKNVARAARKSGIPYIAIEHDTQVYHIEKDKEPSLILGNAEDEHILRHMYVHTARVIVLAIADSRSTKTIIRNIRLLTKTAEIIVRTRYVREIDEFLKLGADEVIPEEFETSIEIFTRVLKKYLVPESDIVSFAASIREKNYNLFRAEQFRTKKSFKLPDIPNMEITTIRVEQGNNKIVGKTVEDAALKEKYGIRILAIRREGEFDTQIVSDTRILQDDILYLFGKPEDIIRLNEKLAV